MQVLPYKYYGDNYFNRLLVEPVKIPEKLTKDGLIIPSHELPGSGMGIVFQSCEDSDFKPGDEVQYQKIDRASNEEIDTVNIEGKVYDVIYEQKIWALNDRPYNQIFVLPVSEHEVSEGGILISSNVKSVTKKGVVYDAPDFFTIKKGDKVEYQNNIDGYFPQTTINGVQYDVLFEQDIYIINGKVAPYRMIVKIDLVAQHLKRTTTEGGLKLSPLFIHMLHNLQYAKVVAIGDEAQKKYPELRKGNTVIIDHGIESQNYRLVKYETGIHKGPVSESRILNCYDFSAREIFAKMRFDEKTHKIIDITPIGGSVFFKWNIDLFEDKKSDSASILLETEDTLSHYHNIDDLRNVITHKKSEAAEKAKIKVSGKKQILSRINRELAPQRHELLAAEIKAIQAEETRLSAYLHKDHLVVCETIYPQQLPKYIVSPYQELYPINILGQKFLIGHSDFLLFQTHKNMDFTVNDLTALSDNVLVLPAEEKENEGGLVIPAIARSKPQQGIVIEIQSGNGLIKHKDGTTTDVKEGDFVLFIENAGLEQKIDGVKYRIMKRNHLLCVVPTIAASVAISG